MSPVHQMVRSFIIVTSSTTIYHLHLKLISTCYFLRKNNSNKKPRLSGVFVFDGHVRQCSFLNRVLAPNRRLCSGTRFGIYLIKNGGKMPFLILKELFSYSIPLNLSPKSNRTHIQSSTQGVEFAPSHTGVPSAMCIQNRTCLVGLRPFAVCY